jgi:mono/diheme cytochrome c family protein/cytochrome c551/c552
LFSTLLVFSKGGMNHPSAVQCSVKLITSLFLILLTACGGENDKNNPSDQELHAQNSALGANYYNDTQAIIDQYCTTCHYPASSLSSFSLSSYEDVYAKRSAMIYSLEAGTMPQPGSPALSTTEFNLLLGWLLNGAPSGIGDALPVARAGNDQQVNEGQTVTLNGTASADDVGITAYTWIQVSGVPVTLSDATLDNPNFIAPSVSVVEILEFELTVTDTAGQTNTDTVSIIVNNMDNLPVAEAGANQTVNEGVAVTLDGTGSSDAEGAISYSWVQVSGPTVTLTNPNSAMPGFNAPAINSDTVLTFQLTVSDSANQTSNDTVQVTVLNDASPIANAGANQSVTEGLTVALNGSTSTDDHGIVTYAWTQTSGTAVTLSSISTASPTFLAPNAPPSSAIVLTFQLTVTDALNQSSGSTVTITVNDVAADPAPVANAGSDQSILEGVAVTLNGNASSDNAGIVSYVWTQSSGTAVTLNNANTVNASFAAPSVVSTDVLAFQLTVTDTANQSSSDSVLVTVNNDNPPTANAGLNQVVNEDGGVSLDGSASSDAEGAISYSWTQSAGPTVSLNDTAAARPSFTAPAVLNDTTLTFTLTVSDTRGQLATDAVQVTVKNDNPPVANAGPDQTVNEGNSVALNGSASTDDLGITTYAWRQTSGTSVTLSDTAIASPSFSAPALVNSVNLVFQLTVTDTSGQTSSDTVQIMVNATTAYTYNGDTKTIYDNKCVSCHRSGGSRSNSPLTTYAEVYQLRANAATLVESGSMPKGSSLTALQKSTLLDWIGGGAPQ